MDPYRLRVLADDELLGLAVDEILAVEPGTPDSVRVVWPRPRSLPPNYGHLAGLLGRGRLAPIRGYRLTLLLAAVDVPASSPPGRTAAPQQGPVQPTRETASGT